MANFQIELEGRWSDYDRQEDRLLKRAYLSGFRTATYKFRSNEYQFDFQHMTQLNKRTQKLRNIRPPHKMSGKAPARPIVPPGPTTVVKVPRGSPGTTIKVRHPKEHGMYIFVNVPPTAKPGQAMLVPVPDIGFAKGKGKSGGKGAPRVAQVAQHVRPHGGKGAPAPPSPRHREGVSGGRAVAAGVGVAAAGGVAVAGAVLGAHVADVGWDAAMADLGDGLDEVGGAVVEGAESAGEWVEGAATDVGDFFMELF